MSDDYARYLDFARQTAAAGAAVLTAGFGRGTMSRKGYRRELVTDVDRASEEEITRRIRAAYPEHGIYAEEEVREGLEREYCWIVDPLDATTNFVHRLPQFGVSMALVRRGEPVVGVVHAPRLAEEFWAVAGGGAWLNGERIHVTDTDELADALVGTGFAYNRNETPDNNADNFVRVLFQVRGTRRDGMAALDLAYTACGRFDGFWELFLAPYDVAAGALLVREAGGRVTDINGGDDWLHGHSILATNGRIHESLGELLDPFPKS